MSSPAPRIITAERPAPRAVPFTFECADCEAIEHRPTPTLPKGWVAVECGAHRNAFCPGCAPEAEELAAREMRFVERARYLRAVALPLLLGSAGILAAVVAGAQVTRWIGA